MPEEYEIGIEPFGSRGQFCFILLFRDIPTPHYTVRITGDDSAEMSMLSRKAAEALWGRLIGKPAYELPSLAMIMRPEFRTGNEYATASL